jgi:TP901 family phage tail tape measure protein
MICPKEHDHHMAKTGEASILAVADVSKFAAQLQKDLNAAIAGITLNADSLGEQIYKGVKNGVDKANIEMKRIGDQSEATSSLVTQQSEKAGASMAAAFKKAGSAMADVGQNMSMSVSLPLAAAGALTVKTAGDFEQMMNKVKAATEATGPTFDALRNQAIQLGSTTAFSAKDAAEGMQILATAGFGAQQIMAALPGVLNLASAGAVDLGTAAEISSDILNGFGFSANDLTRVNDILARAFLSTATDLTDLGYSFKYIGPIAKSAGLGFEEVTAAVGLMGNAGIKGEMAGTSLRGAMSRLLNPTKEVTNALNDVGVKVVDSSGKLLPLIDIVQQLEKKGATTAQMFKIFGQEAGPGMQALVSQGSAALADLTGQLKNSGGTADKVAKTQMEGLNGSIDNLSSSAEGLMIAIGDSGLLRVVTNLTNRLTQLVSGLATTSPAMLNVAVIAGVVVASIGPLLLIAGRLTEAIGFLIPVFTKLGEALATFGKAAMAFFVTPAGWVVLAVAAIVAGLVIAYQTSDKFRAIMNRAFAAVADAGRWLWANAIQPAMAGIVAGLRWAWQAAQQLWAAMVPVFVAIGGVVASAWTGTIWPILQSWGRGFVSAGNTIRNFWTGYVVPAFSAIVGWARILGSAIGSWWSANGAAVFAAAQSVMSQVGAMVARIWSGVVEVFRAVGSVVGWAFTAIVVPAVRAVVGIIKLLINVIVALKPVWIVLGAIVVAAVVVIVAVVKILWSVFVAAFNAIASIVSWLWSSVIKPVASFIAAAVQAVASVVQWLWSSVISPVVMFIAQAFAVVANVVMWLWNSVFVPAFKAIGAVVSFIWSSVIQPVFSAIQTVIGAVVAVVMWFWNTFGPVFSAIGNLVWTVWSGVLSVVFSLFKAGFTALWAAIQVWWAGVTAAFNAVGSVVMWLWNNAVQPALSAIGALFSWLWNNAVQPALSAIGALFSWLWGAVISPWFSQVSGFFSSLWNIVVSIFNAIVATVQAKINSVVATAGAIASFVGQVAGHFESMVGAVRDKINSVASFVRNLPDQIISAVGNLGHLLYDAGSNVVNGLIDGIKSRFGALTAKASELAGTIRDHFPFSPAKTGPLSGSGDPSISGRKIVTMISDGMVDNVEIVRKSASTVAAATVTAPAAGVLSEASTRIRQPAAEVVATVTPAGPTYQITVNALDPKGAATAVMEAIRSYEKSNGKGWRQ